MHNVLKLLVQIKIKDVSILRKLTTDKIHITCLELLIQSYLLPQDEIFFQVMSLLVQDIRFVSLIKTGVPICQFVDVSKVMKYATLYFRREGIWICLSIMHDVQTKAKHCDINLNVYKQNTDNHTKRDILLSFSKNRNSLRVASFNRQSSSTQSTRKLQFRGEYSIQMQ